MAAAGAKPIGRGLKARHACEYWAARCGLRLIRSLGPATACRLAGALAALAFLMAGKRRRIAIENLLLSGITTSQRRARRIARASFQHLACVVVESFFTQRLFDNPDISDAIEMAMPQAAREILAKPGVGVLLVSGHLGNWELAAQVVSRDKPLTGVARAMDNPRVQELLLSSRMRGNFETIDKHLSRPMELIRILRRGRILALLTDQHASAGGLVIPFFGRPAATYPTPAVLHRLTRAPIIIGAPIRVGTLRYRFIASEPLYYDFSDDRQADIHAITCDLALRLEALIRQYPEQYLWAHRRWKVPTAE